jgi:hypothetical protein
MGDFLRGAAGKPGGTGDLSRPAEPKAAGSGFLRKVLGRIGAAGPKGRKNAVLWGFAGKTAERGGKTTGSGPAARGNFSHFFHKF